MKLDEDQVIAGLVAHGFWGRPRSLYGASAQTECPYPADLSILSARDIYMVTSRRHELSPAAHHFREFVLTGLLDTPHS